MTYILIKNMQLEWVLRATLAIFCGVIVGLERSKRHKMAGIRTYVIVTLGAALFTMVSKYGFLDIVGGSARVDVARVSCNIVTGISFLCAGTIFIRSDRIQGLVTSSGIWAMAAVGVAAGTGMYVIAVFATLLIMAVQTAFGNTAYFAVNTKVLGKLMICMDDSMDSLQELLSILESYHMEIDATYLKKNEDHSVTYTMEIQRPKMISISEVVGAISKMECVRSINL